jgi:hypothetical protein
MRLLSQLHDPLHRLLVTLVIDALSVIFCRQFVRPKIDYHWITPVAPDEPMDIFDTHPRIRKVG